METNKRASRVSYRVVTHSPVRAWLVHATMVFLLWKAFATLVYSTVDSGLTNLIHDRCSCTLFTLSSVSSAIRIWVVRAWLDVSIQA